METSKKSNEKAPKSEKPEEKNEMKELMEVEYWQGGRIEFEETGVYPQYLIFRSRKHNKTWKQNVKGDKKKGTLLAESKILYTYAFSDDEYDLKCDVYDNKGEAVEVRISGVMAD
jgi:hypothetical protein